MHYFSLRIQSAIETGRATILANKVKLCVFEISSADQWQCCLQRRSVLQWKVKATALRLLIEQET